MRTTSSFGLMCCCAALLGGCGPKLDLGSNVLWATDHESGDLNDWSAPDGGVTLDTSGSTAAVSTDYAHSGRYSLKLTDLAASDTDGPGVYRELLAPPDAYYSGWYYIPKQYTTNSQWTIQSFRWRTSTGNIGDGHDLNVRALPNGQVVLYVVSHNQLYLQAPLADPPPLVPVGAWFQVETLYRASKAATGLLKVWLDDRLVYDLENRITSDTDDVIWTPCDIAEDVQPAPPVIYVDDAAISLTRVTREGKLFADK